MQPIQNGGVYNKLYLGNIDFFECPGCHALHWKAEKVKNSSLANPQFGACCSSGKVELPFLQKPPVDLEMLFNGQDHNSNHFLQNIRSYNAAFAFASLGMRTQPQNDPELPQTGI